MKRATVQPANPTEGSSLLQRIIGRPSGYIEDFNALPDATKDHMRSVKKVKVFMGLITIDNPMDETGNPVDIKVEDVPFVMDIKNRTQLWDVGHLLKCLLRSLT